MRDEPREGTVEKPYAEIGAHGWSKFLRGFPRALVTRQVTVLTKQSRSAVLRVAELFSKRCARARHWTVSSPTKEFRQAAF